MPLFWNRDQGGDNSSFVESSSSKSSMSSLQIWYRKRKRISTSPSSPLRQDSSMLVGISTDSSRASRRSGDQDPNSFHPSQQNQQITTASHLSPVKEGLVVNGPRCIQQRNTALPTDQIQGLGQVEQNFESSPHRKSTQSKRRRSSVHLSEILPPQDFTTKELAKPLELSQPSCRLFVGRVYRPCPEPGWRVETKARSPESCFTTTRPLYSFRLHSPLVTGRPITLYFEGEIRAGNSEDSVCLALGFVAGRNRASLMPRFEHGSIGINYRDGGLYVNKKLIATMVFKPGQQVGIGMTFSKSDYNAQQVAVASPSTASSSSINAEVFLTRDEKKVGCWNLGELRGEGGLPFDGLEGNHDLYAAVGTFKEVNVDVLFDKRDWRYDPEAG